VITATFGSIFTSTGTLTLLPPEVDYIAVKDAPDNTGETLFSFSLNESESITMYLAGYNLTSGYIMDISGATWSVDSAIGDFFISGTAAVLTAKSAGSGEYSVSYMSMKISATLTVNDLTSPLPPGTLMKGKINANEVTVVWIPSPDSDVEQYIVQRSTKPDGPWEEIGTVSSVTTSFTDSDVKPGKTYYYRVIAQDNASNPSLPSDFIKITTPEESTSLFENILFLLLLVIIIVIVVLILMLVLLSKRKGGPEEEPMMEFEEMQPAVAQPQTTRPPPPRKKAAPPTEKVVPMVGVQTKPAKSQGTPKPKKEEAPPPPPPPPEDAKPKESKEKDKKKEDTPPPPPPPPPE
jgi:hypothetical protein